MNHHTTADFWECYGRLPEAVQRVADRNYALLQADPRHPSLHFKRVGRLWSVRAGSGNRALAADAPDGLVWFWIGTHAEYERLLSMASLFFAPNAWLFSINLGQMRHAGNGWLGTLTIRWREQSLRSLLWRWRGRGEEDGESGQSNFTKQSQCFNIT